MSGKSWLITLFGPYFTELLQHNGAKNQERIEMFSFFLDAIVSVTYNFEK